MFQVGPPFSCGSLFDGTREGYIDLGMWSPGPVYTMAAWVRPDKADGVRRVSNFQGLLCPNCRTIALIIFFFFNKSYGSASINKC